MKPRNIFRSKAGIGRWVATTVLVLAGFLAAGSPGHAQEDDALKILKAMSDYLTSQSGLSAEFEVDLEVITPDIQKIQFASTGKVSLSRPDKLRAERLGGYSHVELIFDGKTLTLVDRDRNVFAQAEAAGSVDQLIDELRQDLGIEMPGGDLLLSNAFDELSSPVIDAKHIGTGIIDGVECEHLAFRNADTDWQIWIEAGDRPLPRKYVITSKTLAAAPQYTLRLYGWTLDSAPAADAFQFAPPDGAKQVAIEELENVDELPPPATPGGGQ
jgi:hypothetical protein